MSKDWVAVDVETAADRDSICAVGIVESVDGEIRRVGRWLLRPPLGRWYGFNTALHGIRPEDVAGQPTLAEWWPEFLAIVGGRPIVAHHAAFDLNAIRCTLSACGEDVVPIRFACSRVVARNSWPGLWSYSLPVVVDHLELPPFEHHDPLEDAMACAGIVQAAVRLHGAGSLEDLIALRGLRWGWADESIYTPFLDAERARAYSRIAPSPRPGVVFDESHPLFGRVVAFTGTLGSMNRREAAQLVVDFGGHFGSGVTKKTNYLVCGYQDFRMLAEGSAISSKKQKAQSLISAGADLELLPEDEFLQLVNSMA